MFDRLASAFRLLRPRTVTQLKKSVEDLRAQARDQRVAFKEFGQDASTTQRGIHEAVSGMQREIAALAAQQREHAAAITKALASLRQDVNGLAVREEQLRTVTLADLHLSEELTKLDKVLSDPDAIRAHVRGAIHRATLHAHPLPYMIVDDVMPRSVFDALVTGLPPAILFAGKPLNHQHLSPPFELASMYSRRIWSFMANAITRDFVRSAVLEKFADAVSNWLHQNFPALGDEEFSSVPLSTSDGRLLLRRRGYRIPPHRDPKWGFITCLLYLPKPGDDEQWGTQDRKSTRLNSSH